MTVPQLIQLGQALDAMRRAKPLVQCLTNTVVTNFTANVLLAAGASPAMVDNEQEAAGFAQVANATLINTGTPNQETAKAMVLAAGAADIFVLDAVGAGIPWRTSVAHEVLHAGQPTIIRGNASEILALMGETAKGRGVDSADEALAALPAAKKLATQNNCAVAVSGAVDYITDGTRTWSAANGHEWMTLVTGVGCALGALMAAFAAVVKDPVQAATAATSYLCVAADLSQPKAAGVGSFATGLVDQLFLLTPDELDAGAKVNDVSAEV